MNIIRWEEFTSSGTVKTLLGSQSRCSSKAAQNFAGKTSCSVANNSNTCHMVMQLQVFLAGTMLHIGLRDCN